MKLFKVRIHLEVNLASGSEKGAPLPAAALVVGGRWPTTGSLDCSDDDRRARPLNTKCLGSIRADRPRFCRGADGLVNSGFFGRGRGDSRAMIMVVAVFAFVLTSGK